MAAVATAVAGRGREAAFTAALDEARRGGDASVVIAIDEARGRPPPDFMRQQGYVLVALQNAMYELLSASTVEEGVVRTVGRGGDTDTNAAIAGALLGAAHGREAVPASWRRAVLTCRPLESVGARRPRPVEMWPVDALELAERLVAGDA